jgi:iron-sulfur cluster repair protein YtfE (RIC family)
MADDELKNLDRTVIEMIALWPKTSPVLASYGLDLCCGGMHSVAEAVSAHGVNPDLLLAELVAAVKGGAREAH